MSERWREPVRFIAEDDLDRHTVWTDGDRSNRQTRGATVLHTREGLERLHDGRVCLQCLEPQSEPFPEVCEAPWCYYPIRADQKHDLENDFIGERHMPDNQGFEPDPEGGLRTKSGIVVPRTINDPLA